MLNSAEHAHYHAQFIMASTVKMQTTDILIFIGRTVCLSVMIRFILANLLFLSRFALK